MSAQHRAPFARGDHAIATEFQRQAAALAGDAKLKTELRSALDSYQRGILPTSE